MVITDLSLVLYQSMLLTTTVKVLNDTYMWPDLKKLTIHAQVVCILLLHIIDTFIHYQNTVIKKITRGGQVCFSTLFLGNTKQWKASTDGEGPHRMAWTQIISYKLALSSVVVCDWCDNLLAYGWSFRCLWVFFLTKSLLPPSSRPLWVPLLMLQPYQ